MSPLSSQITAVIDSLDREEVTGVVRAASRLSLDWYRQPPTQELENKASGGGFDPVTVADRAVEQALRTELRERFPDHAILGEEFGLDGDGPWRWTIDPIDGTRAFITGQPMWGTLLGLSFEGNPLAGWMHLPVLDETYHGLIAPGRSAEATLVSGAEHRDLAVSNTAKLADAVVLCTHPTMFAPGSQTARFQMVAEAARMVRYSGDCVNYGLLAMGLADAVVENQLASYDIVPLIPVVEGAGGIITDLDGNRPTNGGFVVAAATGELHAELLRILAES